MSLQTVKTTLVFWWTYILYHGFKVKTAKSSPHSGISASVMFQCLFALIQMGTGWPILNITVFTYVPSTVVPHHPSVPPLIPVTVLLCCCHRECFLYEKKYFFSVSSSRLIPQILQTCLHWHKYNPLFLLFLLDHRWDTLILKKQSKEKFSHAILSCQRGKRWSQMLTLTFPLLYLLSLLFANGYKTIK